MSQDSGLRPTVPQWWTVIGHLLYQNLQACADPIIILMSNSYLPQKRTFSCAVLPESRVYR
jgi:hypothetical protein